LTRPRVIVQPRATRSTALRPRTGKASGPIATIRFCAGLLAFQRKKPNLGEIYRIAASGGNKQKEYVARGHEIDNKAAKLIFTRLASTNNDTLTSYISLLMTSGLDQWQNPAIDEATQVSDFDFRTIRKKPFTVYLVVQPLMVKPLAPLIRLFFSDLLSAMPR